MPEHRSNRMRRMDLFDPQRLGYIEHLAREAEEHFVHAAELVAAAKSAVRCIGPDDGLSDVGDVIARLLEIIADHVNDAELFRCKVLKTAEGGDDDDA